MSKHFLKGSCAGAPANLNHMKGTRSKLIEKWAKTGLLDGLVGMVRENMAQLLENQSNALLNEDTEDDIKEDS